MKKRILILTASVGAGHIKAAEAVAEELLRREPELELETVDFMSRKTSLLHWLVKKLYLVMLAWVPNLYDLCYKFSGGDSGGGLAQRLAAHAMLPALKKIMALHRPDLVLCTHPFPEGACALMKEKMQEHENLPLAVVMTDYSLHKIWLYPRVDAYFMATENMRRQLLEYGIETRVSVASGIPVSPGLLGMPPKSELRRELGLDELPTVLLMGGGLGLGGLDDTLRQLETLSDRLQLLVIAGRNEKLLASVQALGQASRHSVHCWGYTDMAHRLMGASDLLITKPGALTISEAFALGLPMLLHDPIPGPETENAVYATRHGAAVWLHPGEPLAPAVEELLQGNLAGMGERAKACARPGAAGLIAEKILAFFTC